MTIKIDKVMAHKISPSIFLLNDDGKFGKRIVEERDMQNIIMKFIGFQVV